jgi:hypothetical protein
MTNNPHLNRRKSSISTEPTTRQDFPLGINARPHTPARSGSHVAYVKGATLVVEWYDFGPQVPYQSANMLIFQPEAQQSFATALTLDPGQTPRDLAREVARRFNSYFDVREFVDAQQIAYDHEVDFEP